MENAFKFDDRITIGTVPILDDLIQLKDLGYRTLVDLRAESERFGGRVRGKAEAMGFDFIDFPVSRDAIQIDDLKRFYSIVHREAAAPMYLFSRFGKKPLAFLLIFEAVARGDPVSRIFRRASRFGLSLAGDMCIQEFIVNLMNSCYVDEVLESVRELRPELLATSAREAPAEDEKPNRIQSMLDGLSRDWAGGCNREALRAGVRHLLDTLGNE